MSRQCPECRRLNPAEAAFCFHDGKPLASGAGGRDGASIDYSTWAFPRPFVFPSGAQCHNFLQLALACHRELPEAGEALQRGFLETFFSSLGRMDLALAASAAAKMPDRDRAVDDLLGKLPGSPLGPAQLKVEPVEHQLGVLKVGDDRQFELKLTNAGQRLLYGRVSVVDCPWLALGGCRAGLQGPEAADLVRGVLAAAARKLPEFRGGSPGGFRAWLRALAHAERRELLRTKVPTAQPAAAPEEPPPVPAAADVVWEAEYLPLLLRSAVDALRPEFPQGDWKACWGVTVEGRPAAEVARELGVPVAAVYAAESRVLSRLRQELAGLLD
jgi:DNA-directed RNA polymerase specialized sigma24 family protein